MYVNLPCAEYTYMSNLLILRNIVVIKNAINDKNNYKKILTLIVDSDGIYINSKIFMTKLIQITHT